MEGTPVNDARMQGWNSLPGMHSRFGKASPLLLFCVISFVVVCQTPYLARNLSRAFVFVPVGLFFALFALERRPLPREAIQTGLPVLAFLALEAAYRFLGISTAEWGYFVSELMFFSLLLMMVALAPFLSPRQRRGLGFLSVVCMVVNMGDIWWLWKQFGALGFGARVLGEGRATNVPDTAFSTGVMLLMGTMFVYARETTQKRLKFLAMALLVFCAYSLVFILQKGTTFFLGIALLLVLPVAMGKSSRSGKSLTVFLGCAGVALLIFLLEGGGLEKMLLGLSDLLEGERIQLKINNILNWLQTSNIEEAGGSLTSRFDLAMLSLQTFTSSPRNFLFGVGDQGMDITVLDLLVGNHSQILDTFARYGIFGGVCLLWLLTRIAKALCFILGLPHGHPLRKALSVLYAFFLLRTLLGNTLKPTIAPQLLVSAPLVLSCLVLQKRRRDDSHPGNNVESYGVLESDIETSG